MPNGTGTNQVEGTPSTHADARTSPGAVPPSAAGRLALGTWGERVAEQHLESLGIAVVERNWRVRDGELDLVAWDDEEGSWVAVEVKTRRSAAFGDPVEAVTRVKAARLRRLARAWVVARAVGDRPWDREAGPEAVRSARIRIDVVGVLVRDVGPVVTHLRSVA
ncbi:YraN family protein [Georgenia sp. Z1491]|uniref:YraN family protein n=1 Tax=Georgenia sp. Z1491 TaxID=3416707 RepID=UPI003CE7BD9A